MKAHNPAHILLVEDNRMDVELTLNAFACARLGNAIQVVRTGKEALDYLLGNGKFSDRQEYPIPDLILLDLKLPGIDGHQVLAKVKSTPVLKRIPVIIMTSSVEEGDLILSYDNGANSYLVKPIDFANFIEVVQQIENYWLSLNVSPPDE
ncbi:MAG: response regulator [Deltaproteobacteria bacterium]|nr:MAG: response regulator [Deltaproteobacteria bacterium]